MFFWPRFTAERRADQGTKLWPKSSAASYHLSNGYYWPIPIRANQRPFNLWRRIL